MTFRWNWRSRLAPCSPLASAARTLGGRTSTHTARMTRRKKSQMRATTKISSARRRFWLLSAAAKRGTATLSGGLESQSRRAHGDVVSVLEHPLGHPGAVDLGPVGRPQVGHHHVAPRAPDLGMTPT